MSTRRPSATAAASTKPDGTWIWASCAGASSASIAPAQAAETIEAGIMTVPSHQPSVAQQAWPTDLLQPRFDVPGGRTYIAGATSFRSACLATLPVKGAHKLAPKTWMFDRRATRGRPIATQGDDDGYRY